MEGGAGEGAGEGAGAEAGTGAEAGAGAGAGAEAGAGTGLMELRKHFFPQDGSDFRQHFDVQFAKKLNRKSYVTTEVCVGT